MAVASDPILDDPICIEPAPPPLSTLSPLQYSAVGIAALFFWMLWGDFCFTMLEMVLPKLLPLTLNTLGASNVLIGIVVGSIPGVLNMIITPVISYRSDRRRTRLGRRIPYLLWPTPFIAVLLILIGYVEPIGAWLATHVAGRSGAGVASFTVGLIVVLVVAFQCFNMVVATVYYYLFADVVPEHLMGRFLALFRVVGALGAFTFHRYLFSHFDTLGPRIYSAIALLYLAAFSLMCWRVREPAYPPPDGPRSPKVIESIKIYFRECFSHRYYVMFFIGTTLISMAIVCTASFLVFFAEKNLHMSLQEFGNLMSWTAIVGVCLFLPFGWLADRWHPLRLQVVSILLVGIASLAGLALIHGPRSFWILTMITTVASVAYTASSLPMYVALLPKERFGQMCSAQAMFNALGLIVGSALAGRLIDFFASYRVVYAWGACFSFASFIAMFAVYRGWKARGGVSAYVPPPVTAPALHAPAAEVAS